MRVIVQRWEESERGWGVRPDGYSLHPSEEARAKYVREYWAEQPDQVPDEYSRPCGEPYEAEVDLQFAKDRICIRQFDNNYPKRTK